MAFPTIAQFERAAADLDLLRQQVNGDENATVNTDAGVVPSVQKRAKDEIGAAVAGSTAIALAAAQAAGIAAIYQDKSEANAALGGLPDLAIVEVIADESVSGSPRTRYRKESGGYTFKINFDQLKTDLADGGTGKGLSKVKFRQNVTSPTTQDANAKLARTRVDLRDWNGVDGAGNNDMTSVLRSAVAETIAATNPRDNGANGPWLGRDVELYVPIGKYVATDEIAVNGTIWMRSSEGMTYAGGQIVQATAGKHLFVLGAGNDGLSNSSVFEGLRLRAGAATHLNGTALVYCPPGISSNSLRFRKVWFQSPEDLSLNIGGGDDLVIEHCTFDVSAYRAIRLGAPGGGPGNAGKVTNARIIGCTLFQQGVSSIEAMNVEGLTVLGNVAYGGAPAGGSSSVFYTDNPLGLGVSAVGVVVIGNAIADYERAFNTIKGQLTITANSLRRLTGPALSVGGGGTVSSVVFTSNQVSGVFGVTGAINSQGTGLVNSVIAKNCMEGGGSSPVVAVIDDTRTTGNDLSLGVSSGFASLGTVVNRPRNNLPTAVASSVISLGAMTAGAEASINVIVQGAQIGDGVMVDSTNNSRYLPVGVTLDQKFVSAASTVTLIFRNGTSGTITPPAFQAYVQVISRILT